MEGMTGDTNDEDITEEAKLEEIEETIELDAGGAVVPLPPDDNDNNDETNPVHVAPPPTVESSDVVDDVVDTGDDGDGVVDGGADPDPDAGADDENLDDLLESLDIDNDFECWESIQKTPKGNDATDRNDSDVVASSIHPTDGDNAENKDNDDNAPPPSPHTVMQQGLQKWKERLEREEVYSRLYRPSEAERLELKELETMLHMMPTTNKRGFRALFVRGNSAGRSNNDITPADRDAWNLLIHPEEYQPQQQQQQPADVAANKANSQPSSILLKRGPVLYGNDSEKVVVEGEAFLLTRGLILAKTTATEAGAASSYSLDRAILWNDVTFVEPVAGDDMSWTLTIQTKDTEGATTPPAPPPTTTTASTSNTQDGAGASDDNVELAVNNISEHHDDNKNVRQQQHLTIVCASLEQRDAWLFAMERVLIPHHLHNTSTGTNTINIIELGWQYKLVHRPAFTMAVTGMVADMVLPPPDVLNQLDQYNELNPLHYAVRLNMTSSIRRLLDAGADPNIKDADGRTCMYYAVRDELPSTTIALLEEYGAKESKLAKVEAKGELFGRVQATEQDRQVRRETQQRQEAVEAQVKMNENLRLLNERGEKIEDLGNKASELNENASNFASMAKQLKEKSKKQSKWLPFLK